MTPTPMLDVASYQHGSKDEPIDWCAVAGAGYRAAVVKATEWTSPAPYINPWLERDLLGAAGAGLRVGVYHFAHPEGATAADARGAGAAQAAWATTQVLDYRALLRPPHLGIALDLEINPAQMSFESLGAFADGFLAKISDNRLPAPLYLTRSWLAELGGAPWHHKLWLASPGARPRHEVWAWQFGTRSNVPGFPAGVPVDVDVLYG